MILTLNRDDDTNTSDLRVTPLGMLVGSVDYNDADQYCVQRLYFLNNLYLCYSYRMHGHPASSLYQYSVITACTCIFFMYQLNVS